MPNDSNQSSNLEEKKRAESEINNIYIEIWKTEQEQRRTKWTITTFFLSVSFAILGFSFQTNLSLAEACAVRITGLIIYWFAYSLYIDQHKLNRHLRSYLVDMEKSGQTSLDLQSKLITLSADDKGILPTLSSKTLSILGLIYVFGTILLWFLKL